MKSIEILVVDDNPADALLMQEFLRERYLAKITVAHDGEEALGLLLARDYIPDLILLDLKLPKLNGHETVKRIRRTIARVPIIILSGSRNPDDISFAYAVGVNAYVEKPTEPDALLRMMQSVAGLWVEPLVREHQLKHQLK
ncbi:MAG: response regulator [Acidobacteriia bacterium]|nr:response regulator [Terriglobia bacterium]